MSWDNFTYEEFACKHCGENEMKTMAIDDVQTLRTRCGFPFIITSGYRCKDHPIEKSKNTPGPHNTGLALDIAVSGQHALLVVATAIEEAIWTGFGINQKGNIDDRFIHLDQCEEGPNRSRPWIWTY